MAAHSSTLAWKIPWTEEPGRLQSMGSRRVGPDWATSLSLFTFHFHALEKEMATHSCVLAWSLPGTAQPGGLPSMGSHRVRHYWSNLAQQQHSISITHFKHHSVQFCLICTLSRVWPHLPSSLPVKSMNLRTWILDLLTSLGILRRYKVLL